MWPARREQPTHVAQGDATQRPVQEDEARQEEQGGWRGVDGNARGGLTHVDGRPEGQAEQIERDVQRLSADGEHRDRPEEQDGVDEPTLPGQGHAEAGEGQDARDRQRALHRFLPQIIARLL
ncbi:hypothetical protein D3C87_1566960 [compost metagenome]